MSLHSARKPLLFVALFVFLLFCALIVHFFKIQILEGEKWAKRAQAQHQIAVTEPCRRGVFYGNDAIQRGHPEQLQALVIDVPKFHLYADPKSIPEPHRQEISQKLTTLFSLEKEDAQKLFVQLKKESRSRKLLSWLDKAQVEELHRWWHPFAKAHKIARNALFLVQDYQRSYPFGKLLGQVLHTVREEKDGATQRAIPTGGLELIFDDLLRGKEGKRLLLRSPRHPMETGQVLSSPEDGADVYLTINPYLQAIAEEEIYKAVKKANAKAGWAVLMEPRTGEIWALAQYPAFEPKEYRKYFNDPALNEHAKVKAITDAYEPGSTMKPLTVALALKANCELKKQGRKPLFSPAEKIATSDGRFPGRSKPIRDMSLHHYLNMQMAVQKSSNIYMARLAQRIVDTLGEAWYRNQLKEIFGFGTKCGIELPSESNGLLPTPGKLNPNGTLEWSKPTPFSIAFGHNILVTSLQMVRNYGILANGGFDVQPTLVRKIVRETRDGRQEVLLDNTSQERIESFRRLLEPDIIKEVVQAMKYAPKPGGSAEKGELPGYTEVGKTGTAEKIVHGKYSKKDHFSTFIGFAPADQPRFVLLVAIDDPEFKYIAGFGRNQLGGRCCAPAFQEIALRTLQYLGVEPDDPFGYPIGDPRRDEEKANWLKETKQLGELYRQWNQSS